jgi:DNA-binding NtrC family response regulator
MATILIIEDEHLLGKSIRDGMDGEGHRAVWVRSAEEALDWLASGSAHVALVDIRLPGMSGVELLAILASDHPDLTPIVVTAHGDLSTAVEAMRAGAYDFLTKPIDLDAISLVVGRALEHQGLASQRKHQRRRDEARFTLANIIGSCPEIQQAKDRVARLAALGSTIATDPPNVLIAGETGTGKDLFAQAIHHEGPRASGPYVHVNCAALPANLIESELFGHIKGAFTDAKQSKRGLIELADGGTLFLDEVGELPASLQAKLLVAIETRMVRPVGGVQDMPVNVHLIAATNQNIDQAVSDGRFREELYHRLRVIEIKLPPLRRRADDVLLLAERFLAAHCQRFRFTPKTLTASARSALTKHTWPGNVRELSHVLESAVLLCECDTIDLADLALPASRDVRVKVSGDDACPVAVDFSNGPVRFEDIEKKILTAALNESGGNVVQAATLVGLSRDTMRYRAAKFGLAAK